MHYTSALLAATITSSALAAPWSAPYRSPSNHTTVHASNWASTAPASQATTTTPWTTTTWAAATWATTTGQTTVQTAVQTATPPGTLGGTTTTTSTSTTTSLDLTQQLFIADTAADRFALLPDDSQFVFKFNNPKLLGTGGKGGDLVAANRKTFPALVGSGSGMAVGFLGPCGFNTPHVHLRATELQIVTEGRLIAEMLPENGVFNDNDPAKGRRRITNTINQFEMTPFYQGSVHTQFNPDCTNTTFVAAFNNEDFGTGQVPDELFAFSDDVIAASFGQAIEGADIEKFRSSIPTSIAFGVESCLKKCGIAKR